MTLMAKYWSCFRSIRVGFLIASMTFSSSILKAIMLYKFKLLASMSCKSDFRVPNQGRLLKFLFSLFTFKFPVSHQGFKRRFGSILRRLTQRFNTLFLPAPVLLSCSAPFLSLNVTYLVINYIRKWIMFYFSGCFWLSVLSVLGWLLSSCFLSAITAPSSFVFEGWGVLVFWKVRLGGEAFH